MGLKQFYRYVFLFLLSVFVLTGCGSSKHKGEVTPTPTVTATPTPTVTTTPTPTPTPTATPPIDEKIESVESVKLIIEKAGFSLTSLAPASSSEMQKTNPTSVSIAYSATQKVDITADKLYLITDSEHNEIFATIDANTLFDTIEQSQALVMYHNGSTLSSGYVNLNTIQTDVNASTESILAEIEHAFAQTTLNNPTTIERLYSIGDDVNITYQTALRNQDKSFECGDEVVVIDALKGYSTLYDIQNEVNCTLGDKKISLVTVTLNSPKQITQTLSYKDISPKIFENNGIVELGAKYEFDISSILMDLNITEGQIEGGSPEYIISLRYGDKTKKFSTHSAFIEFTNSTAENIKVSPLLSITKYVRDNDKNKGSYQKINKWESVKEYTLPEITVLYDIGVSVETGDVTESSINFYLDIKNLENVESVDVRNGSGEQISKLNYGHHQYEERGLSSGTRYEYTITIKYKDGREVKKSVDINTEYVYSPPPAGGGSTGGGATTPPDLGGGE